LDHFQPVAKFKWDRKNVRFSGNICDFGIDSSSRFSLTAQTNRQTNATDHLTLRVIHLYTLCVCDRNDEMLAGQTEGWLYRSSGFDCTGEVSDSGSQRRKEITRGSAHAEIVRHASSWKKVEFCSPAACAKRLACRAIVSIKIYSFLS